jgi:hypothetical protein
MSQKPMPSRLNSLSAEGEVEVEVEVIEEEREVQEKITQVKVTHMKIRIKISSLKDTERGDPIKMDN